MRVLSGVLPLLMAVLPAGVFVASVQQKRHRELMIPGPTSAGHHQIEGQCELCHTPLRGVDEDACGKCHAGALAEQGDSHAPDKFLDPARADMLATIDARSCLSCHREHRPEARVRGSVSVAADFCAPCHADVGQQRASHRNFATTSCADAGCHNYHDNRALHADVLARERDAPDLRTPAMVPPPATIPAHGPRLTIEAADAPAILSEPPEMPRALLDWARSSHAAGGINCSGCHVVPGLVGRDTTWKVPPTTCGVCHAAEQAGFHAGKHGMRTGVGLPPLTPRLARQAMKPAALDRPLDCNSCHKAHDFSLEKAGLEACEGCHDDAHTRAYRASAHFTLLVVERSGAAAPGTGVSCATCHLPRRELKGAGGQGVLTVHNQNDTLWPVNRMAKDVCMHCHGLDYALDALTDAKLVERNFSSPPTRQPRRSPVHAAKEQR